MERNRVDGVNVLRTLSVTLERKVLALQVFFNVLHRDAAFNRTDEITRTVREGGDATRLILERRHQLLKRHLRIVQIENLNLTLRAADDEKRVRHIERVHSLWQLNRERRVRLTRIPVTQRSVPRTRAQEPHLLNPRHVSDWRIVLRDLRRLTTREIPLLRNLIAPTGKDARAVLRPRAAEHRRLVLCRSLGQRLSVVSHLVAIHLSCE